MTMIAHAESSKHLRHGYVDLPWSTSQETEPTPASTEIQRAVTDYCSQHNDDTLHQRWSTTPGPQDAGKVTKEFSRRCQREEATRGIRDVNLPILTTSGQIDTAKPLHKASQTGVS